jgi:hypothetical protein
MVFYHYCDFRNYASTQSTNILGCLLRQALEYDGLRHIKGLDKALLRARCYQGQKIGDDFADQLERILRDRVHRAYIIIDALDECVDQSNILPRLLQWATEKHIKILVVSRDEPYIQAALAPFPKLILTPDLLQKDVECFVSAEVNRLAKEKLLRTRDEHLADVVAVELSQKAHGMYVNISEHLGNRNLTVLMFQVSLGKISARRYLSKTYRSSHSRRSQSFTKRPRRNLSALHCQAHALAR